MKRQLGVPFLFDMRGIWADEKVDAGTWKLNNPVFKAVYRYFKNKEKQFLENADYTISLTEAAKKEIYSWKHIINNPVKMEVIPCCADVDLFDPASVNVEIKERLKEELNISETDTILTYLGSIGGWYMVDEMLDFFAVYLQNHPGAKMLFVSGDRHEQIRNKATEKNIPAEKIISHEKLWADFCHVVMNVKEFFFVN